MKEVSSFDDARKNIVEQNYIRQNNFRQELSEKTNAELKEMVYKVIYDCGILGFNEVIIKEALSRLK